MKKTYRKHNAYFDNIKDAASRLANTSLIKNFYFVGGDIVIVFYSKKDAEVFDKTYNSL